MSDDTKKKQFQEIWNKLGEGLFDNEKLVENLEVNQLVEAISKLTISLPYGKVAVGILVHDRPAYETFNAAISFAGMGLGVQTSRLIDSTNNREWLVKEFLKGGYERVLLLDADCVIDARGFHRLMDTMDRMKAAMVCALVPVRNGRGLAAWEDHDEDSNNLVQVTKENIPRSGTPFNVVHCGMSVSLLDLTQVSKIPAPRFRSKSEGEVRWGEDELFCRALKEHALDFFVDPQVSTIMMGIMGFSYKFQPVGA